MALHDHPSSTYIVHIHIQGVFILFLWFLFFLPSYHFVQDRGHHLLILVLITPALHPIDCQNKQSTLMKKYIISMPLRIENPVNSPKVPPMRESCETKFVFAERVTLSNDPALK